MTGRGCMIWNTDFLSKLNEEELKFIVAHELMHLMMDHHGRRDTRDPLLWNIVTDMLINHALREARVGEPFKAGIFAETAEQANKTSEELYDDMIQDIKEQAKARAKASGEGNGGEPMPTGGCGISDPDLDDYATEGESVEHLPKNDQTARREWNSTAAAAASMAAGTSAGKHLVGLLNPPPAKVKWQNLLRSCSARALAAHGRDDTTWQRTSRRSPPGFILPGTKTRRVNIAVVVDTSGSVSDADLAQCLAEIYVIAGIQSNIKWFLAVHDAEVFSKGWVNGRPDAARFGGRGGTAFTPAYDAVRDTGAKFDVMIHFTDGYPCESWPDPPKNVKTAVAAIVGAYDGSGMPEKFRLVKVQL
jgi:predicted metal-dependent peptidase